MSEPWRIELLGWLRAVQGERVVSRFRSRYHAALLAYLAYHADRAHPREALVELLWPEIDPRVGRHRLCQALYSLRQQLEAGALPHGALFQADHRALGLHPAACVTDVARFEAALQAARGAADDAGRARWLLEAVESYRGELLPGFFEEWIVPARQRLAEACWTALTELRALREAAGDLPGALAWARQAAALEPLREESQRELIRLLLATGQAAAARRQYAEFAERTRRELGTAPDPSLQALLAAPLPALGPRVGTGLPPGPAVDLRISGPTPAAPPGQPSRSTATADEAPPEAPTLAPTPAGGSLPAEFTRFFGREAEITRLIELLRLPQTRLVTLTGPGGTGKTRLALRTARQWREQFQQAVWFVPLLDLADPRLILDKLQEALHLPRSPEVEPLEQIATLIADRPALLVLDNFEQLVEQGAPVVQILLSRIEPLTCLVTSRQCLNLPAEREFPVLPLPVPGERRQSAGDGRDPTDGSDPSPVVCRLSPVPSVALFVDRAQAVRPDFQVTAANAGAVAALCQRLEGLPLALELAAARAGVLTVRQMLDRLEQRFELLVSRRRPGDPRHESLRAALDWSYHLLAPRLQRFFAQLSVFRGGWTLAVAAAVCEEPEALDRLEELRQSSLVVAAEGGEGMRYRLLETLREYGAEQLTSEERGALARRHAQFFLALAEAKRDRPGRLTGERDNLRTALGWVLEAEEAELGFRFAEALFPFWLECGAIEGREYLARLLARPQTPSLLEARAHTVESAGRLALRQGDYAAARECFQESLAICQELGQWERVGELRFFLGEVAEAQADYERGRTHYEQTLLMAQEMGNQELVAAALRRLGWNARATGDLPRAAALFQASLAVFRELGWSWPIRDLLVNLAYVTNTLGDQQTMRSLVEEALTLSRAADLSVEPGHIVSMEQGHLLLELGDYAAARCCYEHGLAARRATIGPWWVAAALLEVGHAAWLQGEAEVTHSNAVEALGLFQEQEARLEIVPVLESLAVAALSRARNERAARLLGAAEALRVTLGLHGPDWWLRPRERIGEAVRAASLEIEFAAAWAEGRAMTLDQAVVYALQEGELP